MNSTNSNCSAGHDATIVSFFEKNGEMCLSEAIDDGLRTVRGSKDRKLLGKALRRLVVDGFLTRRTEVRLCRGGYGYPQHLIVYRALTPQERRVSKRGVELTSQCDELLTALEGVHRIASLSNMTHNMMVIRDQSAAAIAKAKAKGGAT
ncbi:hypothetical protein [Aeromonas hydrophila]|uniref:hypothetical protein n=1 Tax=Aeromonas hydrophila TaxID=644 RepID=UPI002B482824|nr:hypothetical protein [Aeromonas hydrophila]